MHVIALSSTSTAISVPTDQLQETERVGEFLTSASDIGLKPGSWPNHILTAYGAFNRATKKLNCEGDIEYVRYVNRNAFILVFND